VEEHGLVDNTPRVRRVLVYTLILNEAVAIAKIIWGYLSGSIGMVSDGFHSLFDGLSNVIGLIGIWIASHPPDEKHPYGHKKYETLFTIVIAVMIFSTCFQILKRAYLSFFDGQQTIVSSTSFVIMGTTMLVNLYVMLYEMKKGKELKSNFLIADALHTKSDLFASSAVITGLILTKIGYQIADALVGVVITIFIARIGYKIIKSASDVLVDTICIDTNAIEEVVNKVEGVRGCHDIRTRGMEHHIYLDLHIVVAPHITIEKAHEIASNVEKRIKEVFPTVVDIVVHTEPGTSGAECKC
jgi:cation diffusion facilitator family transporter